MGPAANHPIHFKSGGSCYFKKDHNHAEPHFHAEASNDETIDTTLPHVYTREEQNALVWLVYRNQSSFAFTKSASQSQVKRRESLFLTVPDFDPEIRKDLDPMEKNLGTASNSFMLKVYRLLPAERDLPYILFSTSLNREPDLNSKLAFVHRAIEDDPNHPLAALAPLSATLTREYQIPGTKKVHLYFFTHSHIKFINQAFQEFYRLLQKIDKGVGNHTSCRRVKHQDFPKMIRATTDQKILDEALPLLDSLSDGLPTGSLFIHEPEKSSAGGWRIYDTDKKETFIAVMYAQATNTYQGSAIIDALVFALNSAGVKAIKSYFRQIDKNAIQVAFECKQLRGLNMSQIKEILGAYLAKKEIT